jgi:multicomponent K+:H+ antiporter subunit A
VAGLVVATAVILQYIVGGTAWAESRTRIYPQYWIAAGLLCAAGAGLLAWLAARPFLSALVLHADFSIIGEVHLSTVLLFDLGVFLLVVGASVLILVALAHQSRRGHRKPATAHVEVEEEILPIGLAVVDTPSAHAIQTGHAPSSISVIKHVDKES